MNYRIQKQIIIGLATLIFLALSSFGIYAVWPSKSDPDGGLSGDSFKPEDIEVASSEVFRVRPGVYDAVALIKNPNAEHGASDISYSFTILGASGAKLHSGTGRTFILPGESKYIIESALEIGDSSVSAEFLINTVEWKKLLPFSVKGLTLRDTRLSRTESSSNFTGIVKNGTPFNLQEVDVRVAFFTQEGDFVSAGATNLQTMLRNSERFFKITWPHVLPPDLEIDARANSNFFENSNFIREFGVPQEF